MLKGLRLKTLMILSVFLLSISSGNAFIRTKIEGIKFTQDSERTNIHFTFNQRPANAPEILARGKILQFTLKDVIIWPRIEKQITVGGTNIQLLAYQYNKDEVRVRAIFPTDLPANFEQEVKVGEQAKEMTITMNMESKSRADKIVTPTTAASAEKFDEQYLEKLSGKTSTKSEKDTVGATAKIADSVKSFASGNARAASKFTLGKYILKFSAFLALVLLLFYAIVTVFKRGVLGKGRLGLLTTKEGVVVLSTTHLAPKKSLVLIKAHTQVFLLANTDNGINLISEIQNVPTLIKNEERETTGDNFDTTLNDSAKREQNFRIKDVQKDNAIAAANIAAATTEKENLAALIGSAPKGETGAKHCSGPGSLATFLNEKPVIDEVKISDKIKSKVKSLRSFQ